MIMNREPLHRRTYRVAFVGQFVWIASYAIVAYLALHSSDSVWHTVLWVYWIGLVASWLILGWAGPYRNKQLGSGDDLSGGPRSNHPIDDFLSGRRR